MNLKDLVRGKLGWQGGAFLNILYFARGWSLIYL